MVTPKTEKRNPLVSLGLSAVSVLARRSSIESLRRDLATETSYRDLVQRSCQERPFIGSLYKDLAQRPPIEILQILQEDVA